MSGSGTGTIATSSITYFKQSVQDMIDFIRREIVDEDTTSPRRSDQVIVDTLNDSGIDIAVEYLCLEGTIALTSPTLSGNDNDENDFKITLPNEFLKLQDFPWYYDGSNWYEIDIEGQRKSDIVDKILDTGQTGLIPVYFYISDGWDYLWIYPAAPSGKTIRVYANLKPTLLTTSSMSSTYSDLPAVFHKLQTLMASYTLAVQDKKYTDQAPNIALRLAYQKGIIDSFWATKVDKPKMIMPYNA